MATASLAFLSVWCSRGSLSVGKALIGLSLLVLLLCTVAHFLIVSLVDIMHMLFSDIDADTGSWDSLACVWNSDSSSLWLGNTNTVLKETRKHPGPVRTRDRTKLIAELFADERCSNAILWTS